MYTEKELKEATQIAYLSFLSKAEENLKADGLKGPYSIGELIRSSINTVGALQLAEADGKDTKNITLHELVKYTDLSASDKSIIERLSKDMLEWKIVDIQDLNAHNGFYGCLIQTSEKDAIVTFRGSENMKRYTNMINDWARADFGLLNSRSTRQQEEAEKYGDFLSEKGLIDKYESLAVTGHSLGGNLASHFTISMAKDGREKVFDKIKQSINFDGPGVSDEYLKEHKKEIEKASSKMTRLRWSAVGTLLFDIPGEKTEYLDINDDLHKENLKEQIKYQAITRHDTKSLMFDENGKAKRGKQDIVSKALSAVSKTIDKIVSEFVTTEIFAATDWIFEKILEINNDKSIDFASKKWAERFAAKGSFLGNCANAINKMLGALKEGAIEIGNRLFTANSFIPKVALADVQGGLSESYTFNNTYMNTAKKYFDYERDKIDNERE